MNYNVNEIKEIFSFFNPEKFTDEDVDDFIDELANHNCVPEFSWELGATKCVIIFYNRDYVVKIPFNGKMEWDYDTDDYEFQYFYNGGGKEGWDYCQLEQEYYIDIIENSGFEQFFLKNEAIKVGNWPIYIQQKISECCENYPAPRYRSVDSLYRVRTESKEKTKLPDEWLAVCLENLNGNIEKLDEFISFLKNNFSDLHRGNIGYIGHQAVVLDYGGYDE